MNKQYNVGIYARLSLDDASNKNRKKTSGLSGESVSIENQREILSKHAAKMGWLEKKSYSDDGYSGGSFDRPALKEMLEDVQNGVINLVLVNDLSRFGRDYIEVGRYTDFILPALGCRFVALSDGIDTGLDNNDMMHFRSILNDYYLKDLSKKIKASHQLRAREGKRTAGRPPYGYKVDPNDSNKFIADEYAAEVVRRIYELRLQNTSYGKIAGILNQDGILSPREYEYQMLGKRNPYGTCSIWLSKAVKTILNSENYIGHRILLKYGSVSYKTKKIVIKPSDEWVRVENVNEPIVDYDVWAAVQAINNDRRTPNPATRRQSLFRGMLRCADCGGSLMVSNSAHVLATGEKVIYTGYQCTRYQQTGSSSCSSHRIKEDELKQIVLTDIQRHAAVIRADKRKLISMLSAKLNCDSSSRQLDIKKKLTQVKKQLTELNRKTATLYEDKVTGVISEQSFSLLIKSCEAEISTAKARQLQLLEEQTDNESKIGNIMCWIDRMVKYHQVQEIEREFITELVDKIEIGKVETADDANRQNIKIYYKMVGLVSEYE